MTQRRQPTAIERQASEWLIQLMSPDVNDADQRAFDTWMNADEAHRTAFATMQSAWARIGDVNPERWRLPRSRVSRFSRGRAIAVVGALAASVMLVISLHPLETPARPVAYAANIGSQLNATLPDGSTVELDSGTRIDVIYGASERRVRLRAGTALFDVRKDSARPFLVETSLGVVRVRGTAFIVHVGADRVRTTVLRGVVEGQSSSFDASRLLRRLAGGHDGSLTAYPRDEISFMRTGAEVTHLSDGAVTRRSAWREGMLAFDGETLREAAEQVSQETGVSFEFADSTLQNERIGGYVPASDAGAFVALLRDGMHIDATWVSTTRVRFSRRADD